MTLFDWAHNPGSTRPRVGMAALSFRERTGLRRLTNTEHQCRKYLTPRRSLSVRFATPAIPGRSEKLLSESGSRPARGLEPVRRRFGSASVVPFMAEIRTRALCLYKQAGSSVMTCMPFGLWPGERGLSVMDFPGWAQAGSPRLGRVCKGVALGRA